MRYSCLLIPIFFSVFLLARSQSLDCANTYNQTLCTNNPCTINSLTALILNETILYPYALCLVNLTDYDVIISNSNDTISGALFFNLSSVSFSAAHLTILSSPTSAQYSQLRVSKTVSITHSSLNFIQLSIQTQSDILINNSTLGANVTLRMLSQSNIKILDSQIQTSNCQFQAQELFEMSHSSCAYAGYLFLETPTSIISDSVIKNPNNRCKTPGTCDDSEKSPKSDIYIPRAWDGDIFDLQDILQNYSSEYFSLLFNLIIISSQSINILNGSTLHSALIAMYTPVLEIDASSMASADSLGCGSQEGAGCGYFEDAADQSASCSGTGGSYGGLGGNSTPVTCALFLPKPVYGNSSFPIYTGSGGGVPGYSSASSNGGGLILIQTLSLILNGQITVDGQSSGAGSGGGAGGAINIYAQTVVGVGLLSAEGGNSKSSGGGGRIALVVNQTVSPAEGNSIIWSVAAGGDCTVFEGCGQSGSFHSSMCAPGYEFQDYWCIPCRNGTYKSTYGYSRCISCGFKPDNAYYPQIGSALISGCEKFQCLSGFYKNRKGRCVTRLMYSIQDQINLLISAGMILGALLGYGIISTGVVLFQKIVSAGNENEGRATAETSLKMFAQKPQFQIEQLPYHQFRIYLSGSNKPEDPWHLELGSFDAITHSFVRTLKFDQLVRDINSTSRYKLWQKSLLWVLKVYYYPLAYYVQQKLREAKARSLQRLVRKFKKQVPDWEQVTVKCNVKPNSASACIEVFNYKRDLFDFYFQNTFPLVLILEPRLLGGYELDFQDPFLKALTTHIDTKFKQENSNNPAASFQQYTQQLNELLLRIPDLVSLTNHLAAAQRFGLQLYLFQPPDNVLNYDPKAPFSPKKQLLLVIVQENTVCRHFCLAKPLPDFNYSEIDRLRWQLSRKQERSRVWTFRWQLPCRYNKQFVNWLIWALNLTLLLNGLALFVLIIQQATMHGGSTKILLSLYLVILPLIELFSAGMTLYWTIKLVFRVGTYSILLTCGAFLKSVILSIFATVELGRNGDSAREVYTYLNYLLLGNMVLLGLLVYCQRWLLWLCRHD